MALTQAQFAKTYGAFAAEAARGTMVSPLLILSQAYLESGGAKSALASKYNNFFGIKADKNWSGKKVLLKTQEQDSSGMPTTINAYFRVYESPRDSFKDHIHYLMTNPRYARAGLFNDVKDVSMQADSLQNAKYATDINYAAKLKAIAAQMKRYVPTTTIAAVPIVSIALLMYFLSRNLF